MTQTFTEAQQKKQKYFAVGKCTLTVDVVGTHTSLKIFDCLVVYNLEVDMVLGCSLMEALRINPINIIDYNTTKINGVEVQLEPIRKNPKYFRWLIYYPLHVCTMEVLITI